MAWRIVKQPNGLFARWSDVVDDFTDYDMTEAEARAVCCDKGGVVLVDEKLRRAKADEDPWRPCQAYIRGRGDGLDRWRDCINTIRSVHGKAVADEREKQLSVNP
jgi:hypothetical protein